MLTIGSRQLTVCSIRDILVVGAFVQAVDYMLRLRRGLELPRRYRLSSRGTWRDSRQLANASAGKSWSVHFGLLQTHHIRLMLASHSSTRASAGESS